MKNTSPINRKSDWYTKNFTDITIIHNLETGKRLIELYNYKLDTKVTVRAKDTGNLISYLHANKSTHRTVQAHAEYRITKYSNLDLTGY